MFYNEKRKENWKLFPLRIKAKQGNTECLIPEYGLELFQLLLVVAFKFHEVVRREVYWV